ncbi:non-hydrolyzing UDP-N-acetylglucosamine 2-epimerase [Aeoliella mucimassa]|uniref:UDP-N-acetylglucosamine 2-epimerase (non-hydrolyzing) n=1 Tax=Aeoliella mucimassa TaxID=2527972 RepID=A0A518AUV9_9BACT|nr:UDP-N-acetylglucosamine 2-epimerase (non-hydrolyzing) [Aeoliella mucimassa]QDU58500.1 UDP-N-acetylglucosamine 2-epimerase [Aeoliella mucimassa]
MRVAVVMGTRPEAIKMAPVIQALEKQPGLEPWVVHTGQHRELIDQVIDLFELRVDRRLDVMQPGQTLASLTSRLVERFDEVLVADRPDLVLVQGDTTSVLSCALASFYRGIPVGHVEAGLRTGNMAAPFPEEANRRLTTPLASLHFAPTTTAQQHLLDEHVPQEQIHVTGNTVIDALAWEIDRQQQPSTAAALQQQLTELVGPDYGSKRYVLVTGHRRENFGDGFAQICQALKSLADQFADHLFVYPVHLNPNVKQIVHQQLGETPNIRLIPPQPYREFVALLAGCHVVLTDSGGVQEEAPSLGKPVLVMRETTERPEGVVAGTVKLVGAKAEVIVEQVSTLLSDSQAYRAMAEVANPYGDGHAAQRIVEAILEKYGREQ